MRFYRLEMRRSGDESDGFEWFTNRTDADRAKREQDAYAREEGLDCSDAVEAVDILPTKAGILRALELYASHADNG